MLHYIVTTKHLSATFTTFCTCRAAANGKFWKLVHTIQLEEALSVKKFADLAAGIPLTNNSKHVKRTQQRLRLFNKLEKVVSAPNGDYLEKLQAIVSTLHKSAAD